MTMLRVFRCAFRAGTSCCDWTSDRLKVTLVGLAFKRQIDASSNQGLTLNPYDPPKQQSAGTGPQTAPVPRVWPLLLMNLVFFVCGVLIVVLPELQIWMLVSVLIVFSVGGWSLARSLRA